MNNPPSPNIINDMVQRIVDQFRPEKIYLFGSRARGDAHSDSDIDLLVILQLEGSHREKRIAMRLVLNSFPVSKDIVVLTPNELEAERFIPGTIARAAHLEGKLLYDHAA